MSYMEPPSAHHVTLLDKISRALTSEDVPRFKNRCLAEGVRPREVEKYSVLELLHVLDRRRVIAQGRYTKLLQILTDIDRGDLVRELFPLETLPDSSGADRSQACRPAVVSSTMNSVVLERDLSWLASKMGKEWKQVGVQSLGMSINDIEVFEIENQLSHHDKIFSMLCRWRCRLGGEATYINLIEKLAQFQDMDKTILDELKQRAA